ncbi:MAG: PAS domain S-box protein [Methanomicrobiales archaeon]|nr:PAS domain S-box protein [Methanomicrobiales archaeon]
MISILYVDSEPALVQLAATYLGRSPEMGVDTALSVTSALTLLERHPYDAIVSDYFLPDMDGIAFLKTLRVRGDETPFILFTGRGREEVVIEALNRGATFYLQKGGDPRPQFAELGHMVSQAVAKKRTDQALQLTRYSVDRASDEIFWLDERGRILYANDAGCHSLGYTRDELLTMRISDIDPCVPPENWEERIARIRQTKSAKIETFHRRKDGTCFPVEISVDHLFFGGKEYVFACSRDITWRRDAERALRASEELFRTLVSTMLDAALILDWDGRVLFANEAAFRLVGLDTQSPHQPLEIAPFISPEYRETVAGDLALVREGKGGFLREYRMITSGGEEKWVEGLGTKISFRGREANLVCIRDVTIRKKTEEALRKSDELFREVFHNANDGIVLNLINDEGEIGRFVEMNDIACARLLYSREELLSMTPAELGITINARTHPEVMQRLLQMKPVMFEARIKAKSGLEIPVEVNSHLCLLEGKKMILSVVRDVTERKITEAVEKRAFEQIERNIDQFAILGDHIRNPLAVIIGYADMTGLEIGKKIVEQARIIDQIITRLDMQWIESEKVREFVRRHYRSESLAEQESTAPGAVAEPAPAYNPHFN